MAQKALGREDHERQRISLQEHGLPAQQVEELRSCRAVSDPQVDGGGQLQKALGAGGRVIRTLPFEAVRQQEHKRGSQAPLRARGDNEFIDHRLSAVDEISVLGFPDHQPVRRLYVISILKRQASILT